MLIIRIVLASFWWYIGMLLLFREAMVWRSVEQIDWFRTAFGSSTTPRWQRFCRDAGLICAVVGGLLFVTLPYGMGALGLLIALPPLILML